MMRMRKDIHEDDRMLKTAVTEMVILNNNLLSVVWKYKDSNDTEPIIAVYTEVEKSFDSMIKTLRKKYFTDTIMKDDDFNKMYHSMLDTINLVRKSYHPPIKHNSFRIF